MAYNFVCLASLGELTTGELARLRGPPPQSSCGRHRVPPPQALFSFLYLKKIKISKIYVRFEIFQNYPRSPYGGRQALSVIFFKICNEVPGKKKCKGAYRPPEGRLLPSAALTHAGGQMSACRWSDHACR